MSGVAAATYRGMSPVAVDRSKVRPRKRIPLSVSNPEIAEEAYGWDPAQATAGSRIKREWKCKGCGGIWCISIYQRAVIGKGFCTKHPRVMGGSVALSDKFPLVAAEAHGWDPTVVSSNSGKLKSWVCSKCSFIWSVAVAHRTTHGSGCPRCAGRNTAGLDVTHPRLAHEAVGWDPAKSTAGSNLTRTWSCGTCFTRWDASPNERVRWSARYGCPECRGGVGERVEVYGQFAIQSRKESSMAAMHPELLSELVDPQVGYILSRGSQVVVPWQCSSCGNEWEAAIKNRTCHGNGCPKCAKTGFKVDEVGFLYFLVANRKGKDVVQYGITKVPKKRVSRHQLNGFYVPRNSYFIKFPNGQDALDVENEIKAALANLEIPSIMEDPEVTDKFSGYSESFRKELLPVESLTELLESLGIDFAKRECELVPVASLLGSEKRPLNK